MVYKHTKKPGTLVAYGTRADLDDNLKLVFQEVLKERPFDTFNVSALCFLISGLFTPDDLEEGKQKVELVRAKLKEKYIITSDEMKPPIK